MLGMMENLRLKQELLAEKQKQLTRLVEARARMQELKDREKKRKGSGSDNGSSERNVRRLSIGRKTPGTPKSRENSLEGPRVARRMSIGRKTPGTPGTPGSRERSMEAPVKRVRKSISPAEENVESRGRRTTPVRKRSGSRNASNASNASSTSNISNTSDDPPQNVRKGSFTNN